MNNTAMMILDLKDQVLFRRGKVRDVYDLDDKLLVVSTDRISAFDVVMPNGIPQKGRVLTQLSIFWFSLISDICKHHLITADINQYPENLKKYRDQLEGRSMLVKKAKSFPVECIVRGYLSGSGWKEYMSKQSVCGIQLPAGLKESEKLPEVIFTPSTKAEFGHDINVSQKYIENLIGKDATDKLKSLSIATYKKAAEYALTKGIIIADTKFEFGLVENEIIIIDEVLTPDSSRFWPLAEYKPGTTQPSFDKQFVRDYLESLSWWDKLPPAPALPAEIVSRTTEKYLDAYRKITGKEAL